MRGPERDAQDEAVTRGAKTVRILAAVIVLTVSAAFAAYAMELHRMVLWQVVRACVADYKLTGKPFPCLEVDLAGGEALGNVVLRPPLSEDTVLAPTRRIKGIEDPFLQSPEAAGIHFRRRVARAHVPQGRRRTGAGARGHRAVRELRDCEDSGPAPHPRGLPPSHRPPHARGRGRRKSRWANGCRSGRNGAPYEALGLSHPGERTWRASNPFRLAAEVVAGKTKDPGDLTVVVVGLVSTATTSS